MDIAHRVVMEAPIGVDVELEHAGSALENPHVYDAVARSLLARAQDGAIEIVASEVAHAGGQPLIRRFRFRRLR